MLKVTVLGLGLLAGSLFAQDNAHIISNSMVDNYHLAMSSIDNLKVGENQLKIDTKFKATNYKGMDVNLTLYTPDNKELHYNHISSGENFKVNLPIKGEYKYTVKFSSSAGALTHNTRGSFSI